MPEILKCEPGPEWINKDAWHEITMPSGEPAYMRWSVAYGEWAMDRRLYSAAELTERGWHYVAPVTPSIEVEALRADRKSYSDELFDLRCHTGCGPDQIGPDIWQQNTDLRARVKELETVLDFYGCLDHYPAYNSVAPEVVREDAGKRARRAFGKTNGE